MYIEAMADQKQICNSPIAPSSLSSHTMIFALCFWIVHSKNIMQYTLSSDFGTHVFVQVSYPIHLVIYLSLSRSNSKPRKKATSMMRHSTFSF